MKGEIYYTGGGIWCAWAKVGEHLYYGGDTYGGAFYRSEKKAKGSMNEDVIGCPTDEQHRKIWRKLLKEGKGGAYREEIERMLN